MSRDPFYPRPQRLSANRKRIELLATGGLGALAVALCLAPPGWAATGSFQGSVATSVNANVMTSTNATNIEVFGNQAIIEWNPSDASTKGTSPVDFQPKGTTATFSSSFLTDYTVLNVVNAPGTRAIGLNGTIKSQVSDGQGGLTTGGTVWFYSRNGFLVGSSAQFDVGSLLLTANRPEGAYDKSSEDGYNHEYDPSQQTFTVEDGHNGTITISAGAKINASNYVALIAPHIVQAGTVRANGEIAYVGAESVDMTMPLFGGLFGIAITTGTDGTAISHTGSTGGPATDASDRVRNIYMVTVPKNDAVTMLIGGSVGYDTAQSATTLSDGTILLAGGGASISGGQITQPTTLEGAGTINIAGATFSNNVTAIASHLLVDASQADITFAGNASLRGLLDATMTIGPGRTATVGGNLSLLSFGFTDPEFSSQQPGTATLTIGSAGTLALAGGLTIDASGQGFSTTGHDVEQQNGSPGAGGSASLVLNGGAINGGKSGSTLLSAGSITVSADGRGGDGYEGGGDGVGGSASIVMNGGSILATDILVSAIGQGGASESKSAASGNGTGGTAEIVLAGSTTTPSLAAGKSILVRADGIGGAGTCYYCYSDDGTLYYAGGSNGGAGQGGTARITMAAGTITTPSLLASATGQGGAGQIGAGPSDSSESYTGGGDGGAGTGGTALIQLSGGTATVGAVSANASAVGGVGGDALIGEAGQSSDTGNGGSGGEAMGGDARIQIANATLVRYGKVGGTLSILTGATGGHGGSSDLETGGNGGSAGHVTGSQAQLGVGSGASVQLDDLSIDATALGGDGGDYDHSGPTNTGGSAVGGAVAIAQTGGTASFLTSALLATATRGVAGDRGDNFRGTAGSATGGSILAQVSGGTLALGTLTSADASGIGKTIEASTTLLTAGAGQGGTIDLDTSGSGILSTGDAALSAIGRGGDGYIDAASGTAGKIRIQAQDDSKIQFGGGQWTADASAIGGNNDHGVNIAGTATAGTIRVEADDSATVTLPTATSLLLTAVGGGNAAIGGRGIAGTAQFVTAGGTIGGAGLTVQANGTGVDINASGAGGIIQFTSNGAITFTGNTDLEANGIDSKGAGIGGQIGLTATGGKGLSLGATTLSADGAGAALASAGGITIDASGAGIMLAGLDAHANGDASTAERISIAGLGAPVHVLGKAQLQSSGNIGFDASGAGGTSIDSDLTVATSGTVSLTHSQAAAPTLSAASATFTVGDFTSTADTSVHTISSLSIGATGTITLASATSGDTIGLTGIQGVQVGDLTSTGTAIASTPGMLDPTHSFIRITAGDGKQPADIIVDGTVSAPGTVTLSASNDVVVAANAVVRSNNVTQIVAGNDVLIGAGASVIAATAPLGPTSGALTITAGGGETPQPGAHSLIIDGTLNANAAPITLSADAIQATGSIRGGALTANLVDLPIVGGVPDDDGGQLSSDCSAGAICLGDTTLSGALDIATTATVRLAGNMSASTLVIHARDAITLGNSDAATTIASGGTSSLTVDSGLIQSAGATTLSTKGDLQLAAATIDAPMLSAQAGGNLLLPANAHDITLLDAIAGGAVASFGSGLMPVTIGGKFTISGTLQAGAGPLAINAYGISINRLKAANGVALDLDASNTADIAIADASASTIGTLSNFTITGRDITIGQLAASNGGSLNGSGAVQVTTDLATPGLVDVTGTSVALKSLGALTLSTLAGSGDVAVDTAGALTITYANTYSGGALSLKSGGDLTTGNLTAATTIDLDAAAVLKVDGDLMASGPITAKGGNIALTLGAATSIASADALAGDLVIHDAGTLTLTAGSATGGVDLTGNGITIGTVSAGTLFKAAATGNLGFTKVSGGTVQLTAQGGQQGNAIVGATLASTGTATLLATDGVTIGTDFAAGPASRVDGGTVSLTSLGALTLAHVGATNGDITLRSGGSLTLTDAAAAGGIDIRSTHGAVDATGLTAGSPGVTAQGTVVTLGSTGALTVTSAKATGGDLTVTTAGNLTMGTGTATGAVRLTSSGGALTFGSLTVGSDLLLHSHDSLAIDNGLLISGSVDLASSAGAITVAPINAGGTLTAVAATDLTFSTLNASSLNLTATAGNLTGNRIESANGATLIAGGALKVDTDVAVTGPLTATGASIALTATGALSVASAMASDGAIILRSGGDLILSGASATGAIDIQSDSGAVTASNLVAGTAGVTVRGTAVALTATAPLTVANAVAASGDLIIHDTGALTLTAGSATGSIDLTGSGITIGTASAGGLLKAVATGNLGFTKISGGTVQLTAQGGQQGNVITGSTLTSTGTATLLATDGITIDTDFAAGPASRIDGASVALTSLGALTLAHVGATGGGITLRSDGNLVLADASATGGVDIQSTKGSVQASHLAAGTAGVTARGTAVTLGSTGALTVASAIATGGDLVIHDSGALTLTAGSATGGVDLTGTGITIGTASAGGPFKAVATGNLGFAKISGDTVQLTAQGGQHGNAITGSTLASTGTATLLASDGITIGTDFAAGPASRVDGASVSLTSLGPLTLAHVGATGGGILLRSGGNLLLTDASATGGIDIRSTNGVVNATGLTAGSAGVTAQGTAVTLGSTGALTVTSAKATGGDLIVTAAGNLALGTGSATGAVRLTSSGGALTFGAMTIGTDLLLHSHDSLTIGSGLVVPGSVDLASSTGAIVAAPISAGGTLTAIAATNLAFDSLSADSLTLTATTGTLTGHRIQAANNAALTAGGTLTVDTDLQVGGPFIAAGSSIALTSIGALDLTRATATAGDLVVTAGGDLTVADGSASGAIRLTSTGGSLATTRLFPGTDLLLHSASSLSLGDLAVTGAVDLASTKGAISAGSIEAGGTVKAVAATNLGFTDISGSALTLTAAGGTLTGASITATNGATLMAGGALGIGTNVTVTGPLNAMGGSIALTATGPLTITSAIATAGSIAIRDAGALALTSGSATGDIDLAGSGITIGSASAGGLFKAVATGNLGFTSLSGGTVQLTARGGRQGNAISGGTLTSKGTAILLATDAVTVTTDFAVGAGSKVDGSSVALTAIGALAPAHVRATNGDLTLHSGGDLTLTDATATGAIDLRAANGAVDASGLVAGTMGVSARGTSVVLGANGPLMVASAVATGGDLVVTTRGDLVVNNGSATGAIRLTSLDGSLTTFALTPGTDLLMHSATDLSVGDLTVDGAIDLASTNGSISTGALGAAGTVTAAAATDLGFTTIAGTTLALSAGKGMLSGHTLTATKGATLTAGGALTIDTDIAVAGSLNVMGGKVALTATGPLLVENAVATTGGLTIHDQGALQLTSGSAALGIDLAGSTISIGAADAATSIKAVATGDIGFTSLSGGTVQLTAQGGAITGANLASTGTAMLLAANTVTVGTDFAVGSGSRVDGSAVSLTSKAGIALAHVGAANGDITLRANDDVTVAEAMASGAIDMQAAHGAVDAAGLSSGSAGVTARGTNVTLSAGGPLVVASATAANGDFDIHSTGDITITSAGSLTVTAANATGAIRLASSNGDLSAATLQAGTGIDLAGADISIGTGRAGTLFKAVAVGNLGFAQIGSATAQLGAQGGAITGHSLSTTGAAMLQATGAVSVDTGFVAGADSSVDGSAVSLTTDGALALAHVGASDGDIRLRSGGDLTLTEAMASGGIDIQSTQGMVDAAGLVAGSAGVIARGTNVTLAANGPLHVADAIATAGDLAIASAGNLTVDTGSATGAVRLTSGKGDLNAASLDAGAGIDLAGANIAIGSGTAGTLFKAVATGDLSFTQIGGGTLQLTAQAGAIAGHGLSAAGAAVLQAARDVTVDTGFAVGAGSSVDGSAVSLTTGSALTLAHVGASDGDIRLRSGGDLTLAEAVASGGIDIRSTQGAVDASGLVTGSAGVTADGTKVTLAANGSLFVAGASASGGDLVVTAGSDLGIGSGSASGAIQLTSANGALRGGALSAGSALALRSAVALSVGDLDAGGTVDLASTNGAISTGAVTAAGDIRALAATDLGFSSLSGRSLTLTASNGTLTGSRIAATAGATLVAGGALTIADDAAVTGPFSATGRSISLTAANGLVLTNAVANGGDLILSARNGGITGAHLATGGVARLSATGAIQSGDINAAGGVTVIGSSIDLTAPGALTLTSATATAGDLFAQAAGDLILVSGTATRSIGLTSTGGMVKVDNASVGGVQTVRSLAALATSSGDIAIDAATSAILDGTVNTGGAITVAAGNASVTGNVVGRTIAFATRGMTIGDAARIGQAGTTTAVTFTNSGTQRSFIGGTSGDGYVLTAAGLGRVQADAITLNLPAAADGSMANPDVTIGDLTLHGSTGTATGTLANLTASGSFAINTPGRIRISGKLLLTDLAATNSVRIAAGPEIDVITPSGSILLTSSSGTPTGNLDLAAQRILIASQTALTDLGAISGTDARSARLATNDGPVTDQGYVAADHLTFRIASLLDVQNSGGAAPADRRGVTVGAGGLDVMVTAPGTPEVILNGRQLGSSGTFASLVRVASADGGTVPIVANGSTVNGCSLSLGCDTTPPTETLLGLILPQQDVVGMVDDQGDGSDDKKSNDGKSSKSSAGINRPLIVIVRPNPYSYGTIIDEPVTGTPNDGLWIDAPVIGVGTITDDHDHTQ